MNYLCFFLPHILVNLFVTYTFYTFLFICIINNAIFSIDAHINSKKITETNNLIFKLFVYKNYVMQSTNNRLHSLDNELSNYRMYAFIKDWIIRIINSIDETLLLVVRLFKQQFSSALTMLLIPEPTNTNVKQPGSSFDSLIMKMMPLMTSSFTKTMSVNSSMTVNKIQKPNPLTYDSDDDDINVIEDFKSNKDDISSSNSTNISDNDLSVD